MQDTTIQIPPGYKLTEVGVIPQDWEVKILWEIANFTNGKAHENYITNNWKYIVVNSKFISMNWQVKKYSDFCFWPVKKDNILMVMSDIPNGKALAKCFLVDCDDKYTLNQRICSLEIKKDNSKLLMYKINRNPYYLAFNDWAKQTNLKKIDVLNCPISLPKSATEQQSIATALTDIDNLISELDTLIVKKQAIKQWAMQQLLTGKKRLPGFSGEWGKVLLGSVCWYQEWPWVRKYQFTSSWVKLLNWSNLVVWKVDLSNTDKFISNGEAYGSYSHFLAQEDDIVIACSWVTYEKFHEKVAIINKQHLPLCMNTSTMRFKPANMLDRFYLFHFIKSTLFKKQVFDQATWSAQLNFWPSHIKSVQIPIPSLTEQQLIARILSDMDIEIESLQIQQSKYKEIKKWMMQQLLTGKIRLKTTA